MLGHENRERVLDLSTTVQYTLTHVEKTTPDDHYNVARPMLTPVATAVASPRAT